MLRNVLLKLPHCRSTNPYFLKPTLFHLPCKPPTYRNYTQFVRNKECYNLRSQWNTVPVRNKTKNILIEKFYNNVYRGFAIIAVSTIVLIKLIGMKLLLLQLTPIIFLLRKQIPMITQNFRRDTKLLYKYFKTVGVYNTYEQKDMTLYKSFKEVAIKYPNDVMFLFDDQKWTYREIGTLVDKLAQYFHKKEFDKGDVVVVFMSNRPDYVALILAFSKLGTIACLLNIHLKQKMLLKRIEGIKCKALIVSRDLMPTVEGIKEALVAQKIKLFLYDGPVQDKAFVNLRDGLAKLEPKPLNLPYKVTFHDKILYTFTGNPIGYSSHSAISNAKFIFTALAATEVLEAKKGKDVVYSVLPFYKAENIATALGPTIITGVKAVIKKKFSTADYFKDCKLHKCTLAQYGGEIGKHLSAYKHTKFDKTHNVRYMFGQGMHHNIWEYVQDRFNVRIIQYYGTNKNIHLVNINFHRGAVGYLPKIFPPIYHPYQIVRVLWHDVMTPVRTQGGACDRVDNYETGMLVGLITHRPDSQFHKCQILDKDGKSKNVVQNVVRKGDKGFLSGDLFLRDRFGYLYYQGLAGDNFRWQAENICVQEVEDILKETTGISFLVYYGVRIPNTVERVGMLLITEDLKKFDLDAFMKTAKKHLPSYAIPVFLRFTTNIDLIPMRTVERIKYEDQSFDPAKVKDKLFYLNKNTDKYEELTEAVYADIAVDKILLS